MTLSTRQIRLIAAFAGCNVLLVLVGWFGLISPQRADAGKAAAATQLAQTELATLLGQSSHGGPTKQPAIHTSGLYALDTALPAQVDQPDLLFVLNRVAESSGVDIISVTPQAAQANIGGYTVVPINLSVSGSYFKVTGFLRNLRELVQERQGHLLLANGPLFAVTSTALTPATDPNEAPATITIDAFYYGVTGGATAPVNTTTTDTTTTSGS